MAVWATHILQTQQEEPVIIEINVRDNDLSRLDDVTWDNPRHTLQSFKYAIWDDTGALVSEAIFSSRNGRQNIPGNLQLVEIDDGEGDPYFEIPAGWSYRVESV